jgi:protein involved in polysaccharide export with SLBB domain
VKRRIIASATSLCLLLLSLGGPLFAAQMGDQPEPPYKLRAGDIIRITVSPQHNGYDVELPILPDGRIYYPEIGEIIAAGKTVTELTALIQTGLAKVLRNHQVTIIPTKIVDRPGGVAPGQAGRIGIMGAVKQPQLFELRPDLRLTEAILQAGGPTPTADLTHVTVLRGLTSITVDVTTMEGRLMQLQAGDQIVVPDTEAAVLTASILGEVQRAGPYTLKPGATLLDLMKESNGPTLNADLKNALLRRIGQDAPTPIDMEALWYRGEVSVNQRLVQGDVLVIPRNVSSYVYLLGGVTKPDAYPVHPGERLLDILAKGGSPTQDANLSKVTLTRTTPSGARATRKLNLKKLQRAGDASLLTMEIIPGDVIVVPTQKPKAKATERLAVIATVLGLITSLNSLTTLGQNRNNNRSSGGGGGIGGVR